MGNFNVAFDVAVSIDSKQLKSHTTSLDLQLNSSLSQKKKSAVSLDYVSDIDFLVPSTFYYEEMGKDEFSLGTLNNVRVVDNTLQLDIFDNTNIVEDFQDEEFSFKFKGDWERSYWDSEKGFVYRSKDVKSNQKSKSKFVVDLPVNASEATLSFDYFVSSEKNNDLFVILINSEPIRVSGDGGWQTVTKNLYGSNHLVEFIYKKDEKKDSYLDRACIDNIEVSYSLIRPLGSRVSPPISLSSVNYYKNSVIKWTEEETERAKIVIEFSLDGGLTWKPVNNGQELPGFIVGNNYEEKNLLLRQKLKSVLSEHSILKSLSVEINCLSKY